MDVKLSENQKVLVLWSGQQPPKDIEAVIGHYNKMVGAKGQISLEHSERLHMGEFVFDSQNIEFVFDLFFSRLCVLW